MIAEALIAITLVTPQAPKPKHFDKATWSLVAADASVRALDVYSTHQMIKRGYHELILPREIANSTPRMAAYSGLCVLVNGLIASRLTRHNHRRMADAYLAADTAQDGFFAVRNLTLHKLKPGEVVK